MTHTTAVVWLRRDLRLRDNPALQHACAHADRVVLAYLHAEEEEDRWADGAATRWWLHHSLQRFAAAAEAAGRSLLLRRVPSMQAGLQDIVAEAAATLVTWNRLYEPQALARDRMIEAALRAREIEVQTFQGALLFEPWDIQTAAQGPFKVFTPFWRRCTQRLRDVGPPLRAPPRVGPRVDKPARKSAPKLTGVPLDSLRLLPRIPWDGGLGKQWRPGEAGALRQLRLFQKGKVTAYSTHRDRPDLFGTSRLSPHLHFGEISARQVLAALSSASGSHPESYLRQLGWREFAHHLLYHFPHTVEQPLDPKFARYPWSRSRRTLAAWQRGLTGYPLVDAGMRELWHTGWMHNRVRLVAASFLTKNLRHHWLDGARWFWDTLVDADLPNNTLGWQWTAGCGADAAPYFRIFNPLLQSQRFDPERAYLRRWVPELAKLPDRWIHRPFDAPAQILHDAGVELGRNYPRPIVDLAASRDLALEGYRRIRQSAAIKAAAANTGKN